MIKLLKTPNTLPPPNNSNHSESGIFVVIGVLLEYLSLKSVELRGQQVLGF